MPLSVSRWWIICVRTLSGTDVGACERRLGHVARMPDRRRQDLGVQVVGLDHRDELAHDVHALLVDVVEANKRREERRPGLGRQQPLVGAEDQRALGLESQIDVNATAIQATGLHSG